MLPPHIYITQLILYPNKINTKEITKMNNLNEHIINYLDWCNKQKRLDSKTLKSYRIDLRQFQESIPTENVSEITSLMLETEIENLHQKFKPKTTNQ